MTIKNLTDEHDHEPSSYTIDRSVVVSEVIDGEAVIINLDSGRYYSLNETGSVVWGMLLPQSMDIHGLVRKLGERFALPQDIDGILINTMEHWISEGLVVRSELTTGLPTDQAEPGTAELREFIPPHLDIYTDMQDFLLVDPIHEVDVKGHPTPHRK